MLGRKIQLGLFLFLLTLCCVVCIVIIFSFGDSRENISTEKSSEVQINTQVNYPQYGTAGFTPVGFPDLEKGKISQFWQDLESAGTIHGVHMNWNDTSTLDLTTKSTNIDLVVVLGYQTPNDWNNNEDKFLNESRRILSKYKQVKYLGIGNEINVEQRKDPTAFQAYIKSYKNIYQNLKKDHPDVQIFPVWQYENLLGRSYLANLNNATPQWEIVKELEDYMDLFAITSYPFLQYTNASKIPEDYFSQISTHIKKPIAFSETAWLSQGEFSGNLVTLSNQGYAGSEDEQVEYVNRLKILLADKSLDVRFINWPFLNDFTEWRTGDIENQGLLLFQSVGLRYNDGTPKKVWGEWRYNSGE